MVLVPTVSETCAILCVLSGVVEPAELPFSWRTSVALQGGSSNPQMASLQQMKDIVLNKRMRPPLAEQWNLDEVGVIGIVSLCVLGLGLYCIIAYEDVPLKTSCMSVTSSFKLHETVACKPVKFDVIASHIRNHSD